VAEKLTHIDLSHVIESGMITYKGLPAPLVCDFMSREESRERYEPGTEFQIGKIEMISNTGTYIDSPFHRYANGRDVSELRLADLSDLDCVVVRIDGHSREIGPAALDGVEFRGKAVLIDTGWDTHWRTDQYFENHPHLVEATAQALVEGGAILVGIDSFNIDSIATGARPVHTVLLGNEVPIVEHLCNLGQVPDAGARFTAAPVRVKGMGSFPVRAFATIQTAISAGTENR
jgi:kynurenine formamidase